MSNQQDAINILLVARGLVPIIDPDSGHPDVQAARQILDVHKAAVQAKKWWFNTETADMVPDEYGFIHAPAGVRSLDNEQNCIVMEGKFYDISERTNIFTETLEDIVLIYERSWDELPIEPFMYITSLAKEEFVRSLESQIISTQAEKDIAKAFALLQIADMRFKDVAKSANPLMLKWQTKMIQR